MQRINQIFNDTYFCTRILVNSTKLRDTFEKNRDIELDSVDNEEAKQEILNSYKKKLQSVYRIRNNAFSYLLKNKFQCSYDIDPADQSKIFYINIEGIVYDAKESAIKNILGKEYESVVKNCLSKEEFEQIKNDIIEESKNAIPEKKESVKNETSNNSLNTSSLTNEEVNDLLELFIHEENNELEKNIAVFDKEEKFEEKSSEEVDTTPINEVKLDISKEKATLESELVNETKLDTSKKEIKTEPAKANISRCPRCFAPLSDGQTICDFCGYDINSKKILSRKELEEIDDSDDFSEDDIDKMFEELEKRLNEEKSKKNTNDTASTVETPQQVIYTQSEEQTVKLYNPNKSEPSKKRSDLIVDIYTLKLKDPKGQKQEEVEETSVHKRGKESDCISELNAVEEKEEDEIIREVKIYVYPLSVPETGSEISSEILVYITQDNACGSFCSPVEGINSVKVNTNNHNFIVRGQWINGNFTTKIFANGDTLSENCEVDREKQEIRPKDIISAKLGHPITFLTVEYIDGTETMKIHAVPLADSNDTDGYCKTLYLMENEKLKERNLFITKAANDIAFEFEDEVYKATAKWDEDTFKMKVENY